MNEERFRLLAEKYWEGSLSDEEARELCEAPEVFRRRLLDEAGLAALLQRVCRAGGTDLAGRVALPRPLVQAAPESIVRESSRAIKE
ncbi:MAG: hypothetical protein ACK44W_15820, partial [Planctomycetota bacterium]